MSLGATMAWTICTNRAGVWILRPTLVCLTELSDMTLSLSAIFVLLLTSVRLCMLFWLRVLPRKCEGTHEYVHKLPPFQLAGVWECGALYGVGCLVKCALVAGDCRVIAELVPTLDVKDVLVLVLGSTPVLTDFGVKVLLDLIRSLRVQQAISVVFEFVVFCCILCFISVPVSVYRKGGSEVVLLRSVAKIPASMLRAPYIGKCLFVLFRAVGTIGDATWLAVACRNNYLSLSVRRRCTVLWIH